MLLTLAPFLWQTPSGAATLLAIFYIPLFFVMVRRGVRDGLAAARAKLQRRSEGDEALVT